LCFVLRVVLCCAVLCVCCVLCVVLCCAVLCVCCVLCVVFYVLRCVVLCCVVYVCCGLCVVLCCAVLCVCVCRVLCVVFYALCCFVLCCVCVLCGVLWCVALCVVVKPRLIVQRVKKYEFTDPCALYAAYSARLFINHVVVELMWMYLKDMIAIRRGTLADSLLHKHVLARTQRQTTSVTTAILQAKI
jgi:hypothetical protein